jgi:uncharacterized membrane protein
VLNHVQPTVASPSLPAGSGLTSRLDSVDLLRGLVMVLMALDHTRGFFSNAHFYPLDLDKTNVPLFLTRWITHFCAPLFVFLAGTGAFLSTTRGKTTRELSWFLLTRGLWLIFLEVIVIRCLGWNFHFDFHSIGVAVIWAIGWSMIVLAGLVHLPIWAIAVFGITMIAGHNVDDWVRPGDLGAWGGLWRILHAGGEFELLPGYKLGVGYPLIPWIGVMAAGYAFGTILMRDPAARRKWTFLAGTCMTVLFVLIRYSNLYGDPNPWSQQKNAVFTIFSFIHCQKYPPSLCFLLMTLGPALILLSVLDRGTPAFLKPILVFGRVPMFYYLLHLPLIHGLAVLVNVVRFGRADWLYGAPPGPGEPRVSVPPEAGFDLPIVYLIWIGVVLALYPLCRWFAEVKRRRREVWLSYL